MIVKFDHVSYSCSYEQEEQTKASFEGYEEVFCEKELKNLPIKKEFLKLPAESHNIIMLQKEEAVPIEITAYPECPKGKEKLVVGAGGFVINTADLEKTKVFYEALGFHRDGEKLYMKPMLDTKEIVLQFVQNCGVENATYLDMQGWGILAFVVDNGAKQKKNLENAGIYTTEIQELEVNGKKLKIFFAKSDVGDLVELIAIR